MARPSARRAVALCGLVVAAATIGIAGPGSHAEAARAGGSRAVVIVDTGGSVRRTVITFSGSVSGLDALRRAGANPETVRYGGSLGDAVCKLYGVGNEPAPGSCPGYPYWAYHRSPAGSGAWQYSNTGPSNTVVRDGDVEGWRFGTGGPPPYSSFCSVAGCAPPPPPPPPPAPAPAPGPAPAPAPAPPPGPAPGPASGGGTDGGAPGSDAPSGADGGAPGPDAPPGTGGPTGTTAPAGESDASTATTTAGGPARGGGPPEGAGAEGSERRSREVAGRLASDTGGGPGDGGSGGPPASLLGLVGALAVLGGAIVALRRTRRPRAPAA